MGTQSGSIRLTVVARQLVNSSAQSQTIGHHVLDFGLGWSGPLGSHCHLPWSPICPEDWVRPAEEPARPGESFYLAKDLPCRPCQDLWQMGGDNGMHWRNWKSLCSRTCCKRNGHRPGWSKHGKAASS